MVLLRQRSMSTWIFGKSLATFDVLSEGLLASELLENSVDPLSDQGFVDKHLSFSVVAPSVLM